MDNKINIDYDKCYSTIEFLKIHGITQNNEMALEEFETAYPEIWTYCISDMLYLVYDKKSVILVKFSDNIYRFVELDILLETDSIDYN